MPERPQRMLDTYGDAAASIADLWWFMFFVGAAICVIVAVLLGMAVVQARRRARGERAHRIPGQRLVWIGGVIVPVLVLSSFVGYSFRLGAQLRAADRAPAELTIEVIGHQYWWEVRYREHGISTANEIRIPAGRDVRFLVRSPDVIHSFWVPQLHGKIDMLPGRVNVVQVNARRPGRFRGQCAEFCGAGHALMAFWVLALEPADFAAWVQQRTAAAATPAEPDAARVQRGRAVFFAAGCAQCHATRGAPLPPELGTPAPDLSDFGSRLTIGAGTLANEPANLARWIIDAPAVKPGVRMPPMPVAADELPALIAYLRSLR